MKKRWAVSAVILLALLEVCFGFFTFVFGARRTEVVTAVPLWVFVLEVTTFGAGGIILLAGGRRDQRAIYLSGLLFTTATAYSWRLLGLPTGLFGTIIQPVNRTLRQLYCDAFQPYLLWAFVQVFPRGP